MAGSSEPPGLRPAPTRHERIGIRVESSSGVGAISLEVLSHIPLGDLLPGILAAACAPASGEGAALVTETGAPLDPGTPLATQGVRDGDHLRLVPRQVPHLDDAPQEAEPLSLPGDAPAEPWLTGPCLASRRGMAFLLAEGSASLGRRTQTDQPDIDLSDLDPDLACSRRHAEVRMHGAEVDLVPFRTTNGTLLNGRRLSPGTPARLHTGDVLILGVDGVVLVYFGPGETVPADFFEPETV
jgi:hypothetical protein